LRTLWLDFFEICTLGKLLGETESPAEKGSRLKKNGMKENYFCLLLLFS